MPEVFLDDDLEVKQPATTCSTSVEEDLITRFLSYAWSHLRRVIAWMLRFRDNLLSKVKGQRPTTGPLSVKEPKTSEEMVEQYVQKQAYCEEMTSLQTEGKVKRSSRIDQFDPTVSSPGVFEPRDCYVRKRCRQVQYLANLFWKRWFKEYLPEMQLRTKYLKGSENLRVDDVVLFMDYGAP